MENKKRIFSWRRLLPFEIIIGIVFLTITFVIASNSDIDSAEEQLSTTVEYMKEQCNNSQMRDLASESKSLLRVTESVEQIRWRLKYGTDMDSVSEPDAKILEACARDSYLAGLILLDKDGNLISSYDDGTSGLTADELMDKLDRDAVMDVVSFSEKTYAVRISFDDESHIDLAAVGRADEQGIIIGYYYTSSEYARTFNNSIRPLVSGYTPEHDGTIVISSGNHIVASNDDSLIGKNTEDVPILNYIMKRGSGKKLVHTRGGMSMTSEFGLMDKSQNYYIYAYMTEHNVFVTTPRNMLYTFFVYSLLVGMLHMVWWRAERTYQDKQEKVRLKYTEDLEVKNEQLKEAAARADKANAAKSNFLSRMSHDIRTPLNGIIGLLRIDEAHFDDHDLVKDNHSKMLVAADHLLSLINDVLQMSKLEDGNVELTHEVVDLYELSREVGTIISTRTADAGITLEIGDQELPVRYVYGSPLHLRQIFLNVYGNSIKYNKVGGKVMTSVKCLGQENGIVTYRWTVEDTGIGMSEEFLKHIFDPFAQEHSDARSVYMGTGLGMTIVHGLVSKMNGNIDVTSKEGLGTRFEITIPLEVADGPEDSSDEAESEVKDLKGLHMMLVEDNDLNAEIAQMLLEDKGADVTLVTDGKQALELFRDSAPETFDAVLMDVMMPVMDGITATKAIRALNRPDAKEIVIIAMTANAFEEDAKKCISAGMNAHLAKPLQIDKVVAEINHFCRKQ